MCGLAIFVVWKLVKVDTLWQGQMFIIESVNSICRDSADPQYMMIQNISKTVNLQDFITTYIHLQVFS